MPDLNSNYRYPVKGKTREYFCSPLTDDSHDALNAYVRSILMDRQAELINRLKTDAQQRVAITGALQQTSTVEWMKGAGLQIMGTLDGVLRLLYEGCRVNDQALEYMSFKQDILNAYNDHAEAARIARVAFEATNPKVQGASAVPATNAKTRSRSQRKKPTSF